MLTRAEKQLAESLLDNYPVSGLGSITTIAENAGVSTPTVVRMVQKLGFKGYPDFQAHLHQEVEATISNPIAKHDRWASNAPGTHILNRFADAIIGNLRQTLSALDTATFDSVASLLSDRKRGLYFVGGRITGALAEYFFTHMQVIRPNTALLSSNSSSWPQYVLNMNPGDLLVIFDIRRYEQEMVSLATAARKSGAEIVVFTDQWGSPAAKLARHTFRVQIEAPSAWDTSVVTLFIVEALIEAVQSSTWDETKERMKTLEGLFEQTRLFRKLS
jgi:DNA-binding MurR/RpiR family transcriptional regulator|nr:MULTISPECIES: MurR/RpiR family transcriptional regulator [unclassified Rhizobium]